MKKAALIVLGVWLMSSATLAAEFRVEVKGAFYTSEDSNFKDVYGGAMKFGLGGEWASPRTFRSGRVWIMSTRRERS